MSRNSSQEEKQQRDPAEIAQRGPVNRKSPFEHRNIISQFFFTWLSESIQISSKCDWTQEMNYNLATYDQVRSHKPQIWKRFRATAEMLSSIFRVYTKDLLVYAIAVAVYKTIVYYSTTLTSKFTAAISNDDLYQKWPEVQSLLIMYLISIVTGFAGLSIQRYYQFVAQRNSLAMRSALFSILQDKIMRFSPLNSTAISEGLITNLIQVDSVVIKNLMSQVFTIMDSLIGMGIGIIFMGVDVGVLVALLYAGYLAVLTFMFFLTYLYVAHLTRRYLAAKDRRMSLFKNVLENIDFIKINGLEDYFCLELFERREQEVIVLRILAGVYGWKTVLDGVRYYLSTLIFMLLFLRFPSFDISISGYYVFSNYSYLLTRNLNYLILGYQYYVKLKVSIGRLNTFLNAREKNRSYVQESNGILDQSVAFKVSDGNFKWRYSQREELMGNDELNLRDQAYSTAGEAIGVPAQPKSSAIKDEDSSAMRSMSVSTRQNLLTMTATDESLLKLGGQEVADGSEENQFYIKDINLEVFKGEKIAVIGKSNSGTSSLLYCLLGEMIPLGAAKVVKCGSVTFLSQSRWLLGETIKENITMGKEFDEELMNQALEMSQLVTDMEALVDGIDTVLGDNGDTVSGGQRARIALARCFYQK